MKKSIFATLVALFLGVVLCAQPSSRISSIAHELDSAWNVRSLYQRVMQLKATDVLLQSYGDSIAHVKSLHLSGKVPYGSDSLLVEKMITLRQLCVFAYTREYLLLKPVCDSLSVRVPPLQLQEYFLGTRVPVVNDTVVVEEETFLQWHASGVLSRVVKDTQTLLDVESIQSFHMLFTRICAEDTIDWKKVALSLDSMPASPGVYAPWRILSYLCDSFNTETSASRDLLKDVERFVRIQDTFMYVRSAEHSVRRWFDGGFCKERCATKGSFMYIEVMPENKKGTSAVLPFSFMPKKEKVFREVPTPITRL